MKLVEARFENDPGDREGCRITCCILYGTALTLQRRERGLRVFAFALPIGETLLVFRQDVGGNFLGEIRIG